MKSGQTIFRAEGRHKKGPKAGQIKWVRYRDGARRIRYHIRHKLTKPVLEALKNFVPKLRISKHHNKAKPKRDFARRRT